MSATASSRGAAWAARPRANVGSARHNDALSLARADAVRSYLVEHGVSASRMAARGFGFSQPAVSNDTPEGRDFNRRVEFNIMSLEPGSAAVPHAEVPPPLGGAMTQSQLSLLGRRDDFLLSTLRRYVAALGGSLEATVNLGSSSFRLSDGEQATAGWQLADVHTALEEPSELKTWLPRLVASVPASMLRERRSECGAFSLLEHGCHLRVVRWRAQDVGHRVEMEWLAAMPRQERA